MDQESVTKKKQRIIETKAEWTSLSNTILSLKSKNRYLNFDF